LIRLQAIFRRTSLQQLPLVEQAMGRQALALLIQLNATAQGEHELAEASGKKLVVLCIAPSRTTVWPRSATCGPSLPYVYPAVLELITTGVESP
jgi:hypothetical protein